MSKRHVVKLFYDVISPYSWLGFETLCRYRTLWALDLRFCPVFLGAIMGATNITPPGMIPRKGKYMEKDLQRLKELYCVPLNLPSDPAEVMFNKGSLSAQRLLTATKMSYPNYVENLSRALWTRVWSKDLDIASRGSLKEACQNCGMDSKVIEEILGRLSDQDVKDELRKTTDEVLSYGAFGAPTIVIFNDDGKADMFFGSDRFELIAHLLGVRWLGPHPSKL
ncbi:glutathione S-transferase kappa 1-like [Corticium candelabrum]|uniref:glutathione S-transferase kappa 1-like n=1 Tax=Corticium candelabrum TaxID=121492 RepID=UPI002E256DB6|nr:glutathione S-transferase kappa 1-like [Corticium candelabrum]